MATNDNGTPPTVLPFKPRVTPKVTPDQGAPDKSIVQLFEDYLDAAKKGKIKFAAVATVDDHNTAFSTWEPDDGQDRPQLLTSALGAVSYLHFRFNQSCAEGADYDDSLRPEPTPA